jgi:Tfp pilus assembly PilM family ATPase/Tfp pilus assembly protein PilN
LKEKFFTLSYDDKEIKVLQIQFGRYFCVGSANIETGVVTNGKILRKNLFAETLRKLLASVKPYKITTKQIVASVPESKVFIKILEIPKIDKNKIAEAIGWQAESLLPVSPENVYLDWQQIAETPEGKIKILITACPKDVINSLIQSLEENGFTIIGIKSKAGALAGTFASILHKPVLIINIEQDETSLIIAKNNVARVSTSIPTLKDHATLLEKITETINFYEQKKGEKEIKGIVLLGSSDLSDLKNRIATRIEIPIKFGQLQNNKLKITKENETKYLINLALYLNPFLGVNLLPAENIQKININRNYQQLKFVRSVISLISIIIILGLLSVWLILMFESNKYQKVLTSAQLTKISPKAQRIEDKIIDLNNKINRINSLVNSRSSYYSALNDINSITQEGVNIISLVLENQGSKFKLTGTADTRDHLLSYKEQLQNQGSFVNITVPLKSLEKPSDISFEINFNKLNTK